MGVTTPAIGEQHRHTRGYKGNNSTGDIRTTRRGAQTVGDLAVGAAREPHVMLTRPLATCPLIVSPEVGLPPPALLALLRGNPPS